MVYNEKEKTYGTRENKISKYRVGIYSKAVVNSKLLTLEA